MSQSLVQNYLHIVFSTKHRQSFILPQFEDELYDYLGGTCKKLDCQPIKVGGHVDHVHILCKLSKKLALMTLLEEVKKNSSKWMKTRDSFLRDFYWQNGYGAFSITADDVDRVAAYIANQRAHHSSKTFQDEFRLILKKYKVDFDERYVWD